MAGQTQKTLTKSLSQYIAKARSGHFSHSVFNPKKDLYIAKALKPKLEKKLYAQAENPPGSSPFFEKRLHHRSQRAENPPPPCHINRKCLNQLHNKLLNKKDEDGIHFNCQWAYKNNHLCCKDPTGCFLSYATDEIKEELDDKLKTLAVSQACSQEGISSLNSFLSDFQGDFCEKGVRHCKEFCEHTLKGGLKSSAGGGFVGEGYQPSVSNFPLNSSFPDEGKGLLEEDKKDLSKRELSSIKTPSLKEPLLKSPESSISKKALSSKAMLGKNKAKPPLKPQSAKNPIFPQTESSSGRFSKGFSGNREGIYPHSPFFIEESGPSSHKGKATEDKLPKSFLEKAWSKTKKIFSSAFKWWKFEGKEDLKSAWFSLKGGGPQVVYQSLFQSVEAPQLEPIFVQELQSEHKKPVFKSYDLVRGKPAGVLIRVEYKKPELCLRLRSPKNCWKRGLSFQLKLQVKNQVIPIRCLSLDVREPLKIPSRPMSEQECFFKSDDFFPPEIFSKIPTESSSVYKFIEFPTESIEPVDLKKYIDRIETSNTGYTYHNLLSSLGFSDRVVKDIDSENSHVPIRINIVDHGNEKMVPNLSVLKSKVPWEEGLGNCERNVEDYFKAKLSSANIFCVNVLELWPLNLGWTRIKGSEGASDIAGFKKGTEEALRIKMAEADKKRCILSNEEAEANAKIPGWGESSKNGYKAIDLEKVRDFASSEEMKNFVPTVFPISKISSEVLITTGGQNFIPGSCDIAKIVPDYLAFKQEAVQSPGYPPNTYTNPDLYHRYQTKGLLEDLQTLEFERVRGDFSKLFVVVPRDYFIYHGIQREEPDDPEIYGWTPLPKFFQTTGVYLSEFDWGFLGGIAFVREDQVGKGALSHELAHLLGQRRDFYDQEQKCQWFSGHSWRSCKKYEIPIALDSWIENDQRHWRFIKKRLSLMGNNSDLEEFNVEKPDFEESDAKKFLKKIWMDRETHQRVFSALAKINSVLYDSKKAKTPLLREMLRSKKLLISGFYNKEKKEFVVPQMRLWETDWVTSSWSDPRPHSILMNPKREVNGVPLVLFQLRGKKGQAIQSIYRPVFDIESGFLYEGKDRECGSEPFEFSMVSAVFNLSNAFERGHDLKDLRVLLINPDGEEIFSSPLPED